jgi:hypothetical protein
MDWEHPCVKTQRKVGPIGWNIVVHGWNRPEPERSDVAEEFSKIAEKRETEADGVSDCRLRY